MMFSLLIAKDLGIHGTVYKIEEESLIDYLRTRLKEMSEKDILRINKKLRKLELPKALKNLPSAKKYRCYYFDPSVTLKTDNKDGKGNLILKKGTTYNPLKLTFLREELIFLDGDNKEHVEWAKQLPGKLILIKGDPIELEKILKRPIYFDQFGQLSSKFRIEAVPAKISQHKLLLKIEEIPIQKIE